MTTILNFFKTNSGQFAIVLGLALVSMIATYLIYWVTNKNSFIKYLLGLILIFFSLYTMAQGLKLISTEDGLSLMVRGVYLGVAGLVSILLALILRPKTRRRTRPRRG